MNTAQKLRMLREQKKMSQEEVAKAIGVGRTTYLKYESGENKPTRRLKELSQLFGVSYDYILGNDKNDSIIEKQYHTSEIGYLADNELSLIKKYRALDERGKGRIDNALDYEYKLTQEKSDKSSKKISA